ncbi:MAG: hypothetical protein ABJC09_06675 [Terriglobia bacterium]
MRVILAYKNFAANRAVCHIGLGVTALNAARTLRDAGIQADVWPIITAAELRGRLSNSPATHVIVSAPWIATADLAQMCVDFPETQFAVNCHSNLGFLQADPSAMRLVREGLDLGRCMWNFRIAANCERLARWVETVYHAPCLCLPNIYHLGHDAPRREGYKAGTLRIGIFGATRALKNLMTAAGAAIAIADARRSDLEIWISSGRNEGAGCVVEAVRQMTNGLHNVKLIENAWQTWPQFRQTVGHMHLLLQPSYTESFNVVTADGAAEGIPSVVSHAIEWAPDSWKAEVDDANEIAKVGLMLLRSRRAARRGLPALRAHNRRAMRFWMEYLEPDRMLP